MKKSSKKYNKKLNTRKRNRKQNKRTQKIQGGGWFNWLGVSDSSIGNNCEKCEKSDTINSPKELTSIGDNKTYQLCTPDIKYIYISPINVGIVNDAHTMQTPKFKIKGQDLAIKFPTTKIGWFGSEVKNNYYVSIFIKYCNTWFMQLKFDISKKSPITMSESIYKINSTYVNFKDDINLLQNSHTTDNNEIILNSNCATIVKSDSTDFKNIEPFLYREDFKRASLSAAQDTVFLSFLKVFVDK